ASVLNLEKSAVGAEDRNRTVVRHLARLHMINLGSLIKRSLIRVLSAFSSPAVHAAQVLPRRGANRPRRADRRHADPFSAHGSDGSQRMNGGVFLTLVRPAVARLTAA